MLQLFYEGGLLFMSIITLFALIMFFFSAKVASVAFGSGSFKEFPRQQLYYVRFFGMLALVTGVLGQIIGLYEAMKHIAAQGGISQEILASGFRVSSITTLYGFFIFLLAHLIWFGLDLKVKANPGTS